MSSSLSGIDCSCFVREVLKRVTGKTISRVVKTQAHDGKQVLRIEDSQAGDAILYTTPTEGHVAFLTGKKTSKGYEIVHASGSKTGVIVSPKWSHDMSISQIRRFY